MNKNITQLIIYTPKITERLKYIFEFIFTSTLKINYELTTDIEYYKLSKKYKLTYSYSDTYKGKYLFLKAKPILFEEDIKQQKIDIFEWKNEKVFFISSTNSIIPFDIFSASFYLLSRYEEYLPFKEDIHGRFSANISLAFKNNFLEKPIINIWAQMFKNKLLNKYPELEFGENKFKYLPTIDIDNTFAHLHKGFLRTFLSYISLLIKFDFKTIVYKTKVLRKKLKDPYNNFYFLKKIHQKYGYKAIYFVLFSKYSKFDKNISISNKNFVNLLKEISLNNEIAAHPSYKSNKSFEIVKDEKNKLEKIIEQKITKSRQHFLKLKFPDTYRNLIKLGIKKDYSMGYSTHCGFRAGTCNEFSFFDILANKKTDLKIIPFSIMDIVLVSEYNNSNSENLLNKKTKEIIENIKKVEGLFVSLWHNEYLNLKLYQNVYEEMIKQAKKYEE